MASPTWAEHVAQLDQLPDGLSKPAPVAVPDATAQIANPDNLPTDPMDPEFGPVLLALVDEWFGKYGRYQSVAQRHRPVLWSFHTWLRDPKDEKLVIPMSPIMMFIGNKGCGKSNQLQMLNLCCARTDDLVGEPTGPAMRSILGPENLTALVDEADILLGMGARKEEVRYALNASRYPNGHTDRIQGGIRVKDYVHGCAALAALPSMKVHTGSKLETLFDRAIEVNMIKSRCPDILESPFGQEEGRTAGELMQLWIQCHLQEILDVLPTVEVPGGLFGRDASKWKPLLAICAVAGGPWPDYGRRMVLNTPDNLSLAEFSGKLSRPREV